MCYTIGIDTLLSHINSTDMFLKKLSDNGFVFGSFEGANQLFIKVFLDSDESKNKMGDLLSEFIYENYVKSFFSKVLDECYYYFEKSDKDEMFAMLNSKKEKAYIKKEILKYFWEDNTLYLKGFRDFRLTDYFDRIYDKAQYIADDYLDKKEYMDFIKLLKYFVSVQNTACERVDVIRQKNGEYVIFDESKNETSIPDCEISVEIADEELGICDVLLSELISLAPKKIVIHKNSVFNSFDSFANNEILKMIESVFEKNVEYCTGCEFCNKFENENISIKSDDKIDLDSDFFKKI